MIPNYRTANNPHFTINESNEILQYLKRLMNAEGINSTKYGTQILNYERDPTYITLNIIEDIPPCSILLAEEVSVESGEFYQPMARADGFLATALKNPSIDVDKHRYFYCTNGPTEISFSSSSSSSSSFSSSSGSSASGTLQCHIIGTHRPHLVRTHSDIVDTPYDVGQRVDISIDGSGTVRHSTTGPFVCVSVGDRDRKLVWIVAHHHQLSYLPWVRTTTTQGFPDYPTSGNTFVVERGELVFDDSSPGQKILSFNAVGSLREIYIAISLCGYLAQGSIKRMSRDGNRYYLIDDCDVILGQE